MDLIIIDNNYHSHIISYKHTINFILGRGINEIKRIP